MTSLKIYSSMTELPSASSVPLGTEAVLQVANPQIIILENKMTKQQLLQQLEDFAGLEFDYDGQGAGPPCIKALNDASQFIESLDDQDDASYIETCELVLSPSGEIGIDWSDSTCKVSLLFSGGLTVFYHIATDKYKISGHYQGSKDGESILPKALVLPVAPAEQSDSSIHAPGPDESPHIAEDVKHVDILIV